MSSEMTRAKLAKLSADELADYFNKVATRAVNELSKPEYCVPADLPRDKLRHAAASVWRRFVASGCIGARQLQRDPVAFLAALYASICADFGLAAKSAIHFELFGQSVAVLGTSKHEHLLDKLDTCEIIGCFCMTEVAHGSNVAALQTTARYDPSTQEFVINTPSDSARKIWIGNSFTGSRSVTVVFARLMLPASDGQVVVDGVKCNDMGVHAFVAPLFGTDGRPAQGVTHLDCGPKIGWHAVDNSCIHFRNVRVPRDNLLDKLAQVDASGAYHCAEKSPLLRFSKTLNALAFGRLIYCAGPVAAVQLGTLIATRYAYQRRQFGAPGQEETLLKDYTTHQRALSSFVAESFVYAMHTFELTQLYVREGATADFHARISGLKATIGEWSLHRLSRLRIMCGGHGYSQGARVGELRADMDNFCTAEGDTTVLRQSAARLLLKKAHKLQPTKVVLSADLDSVDELAKALQWRADFLLQQAGMQLMQRMAQEMSSPKKNKAQAQFDAWNEGLPKTLEAVDACTAADSFRTTIELLDTRANWARMVPGLSQKLLKLFAVLQLQLYAGDFLRHGVLTPAVFDSLAQRQATLSAEVLPHIEGVLDATLRLPDSMMGTLGKKKGSYVDNLVASLKPYPAPQSQL